VALVERLPVAPPSWVLALALDRWLLARLPADARAALLGRTVLLEMIDFGLQVRLVLGPRGFRAAGGRSEVALRISATAEGFVRLARGDDDPDRLFFERQLLMEGDTELGLVLKNTLDAIGPLWSPPRPAT
jgi:predicted lipid carrier protein YhbT